MAAPIGVHLVGSIPLSDTEEVFRQIPAALPNRLYSIPDGEPGVRQNYIAWELPCFPKETWRPYLPGSTDLPADHPGFTPDSVAPSHYAGAALESYKRFVQLRDQGIISPGVRFQVSLPSPLACIQGFLRPEFHAQLEPFYERRILDALNTIIAGIPAPDLAVQWDLAYEVMDLEYERGRFPDHFFKPHFAPIKQGVLDRIRRLCVGIPVEVHVGFHLCYGDFGGKHFIEPEDLGVLVEFANDIVKTVRPRAVDWVHMPVPKDRPDRAYFEPLNRLAVDEETRLVLGLVHFEDEEGTRRRIQAAQKATRKRFSVATECGMGRVPKEQLDSILRISKEVTKPID
ncbi:hypothetical protein EYZ11_007018 [Aspergillus tanneri]|uniref:Cobalamin-independent methionine synthase MetE C-terminal/archaeal domain-containing protein n=1 Tax=Aspergillus tanneri TaxID=1220188 RepID=A0A4V3UP27_9EURO|nr:uncharacterized protein ATNIH1004_010715 [Aspergillus tanneri]KAA8641776.1 hypothetical protein ATNIH1004_010715 [Aspergillus tanneri]THC93494.1 hypothetical protein EYZ11_007018 [Aspergillus tanneri]